jgi:hypothetical protein
MVLFEMLTLQMPYESYDGERLLTVVQKGKRSELPPSLATPSAATSAGGSSSKAGASASSLLDRLVALYTLCTSARPVDRPSAADVVKELAAMCASL